MTSGDGLEIRLVKWIDSTSVDGWCHRDELTPARLELSAVTSVGFVWSEDDDGVVLVAAIDPTHDNVGSAWSIPKVNITSSTTLRPAQGGP